MKKILLQFTLTVILLFSVSSVVSADEAKIDLIGEIHGNSMTIDVNLSNNPGILYSTFEIEYDNSIMTLTGLKYGDALVSLNPIMTNTDTPAGFGFYPFRVNYFGDTEDKSNGKIFTITFDFLKGTEEGDVSVSVINYDNDAVNEKLENVSFQINPVTLFYEGYKSYTTYYVLSSVILVLIISFIVYRTHAKKS